MGERDKFRVRCGRHNYDTLLTLYRGTAINAARMHALLPCESVEVLDYQGKPIDWKTEQAAVSLPFWMQNARKKEDK